MKRNPPRPRNMDVLAGMNEQMERRANMMLALALGSVLKELNLTEIEIHPETMMDVANNHTVTIDTDPATNIQKFSIKTKVDNS